MTNAEITKLAKDLKAKKMQAAELADEIAEIEAAIKSEMEARDVEELKAGLFVVKWSRVTSRRLGTTAFKAALPDLSAKFCKARRVPPVLTGLEPRTR